MAAAADRRAATPSKTSLFMALLLKGLMTAHWLGRMRVGVQSLARAVGAGDAPKGSSGLRREIEAWQGCFASLGCATCCLLPHSPLYSSSICLSIFPIQEP